MPAPAGANRPHRFTLEIPIRSTSEPRRTRSHSRVDVVEEAFRAAFRISTVRKAGELPSSKNGWRGKPMHLAGSRATRTRQVAEETEQQRKDRLLPVLPFSPASNLPSLGVTKEGDVLFVRTPYLGDKFVRDLEQVARDARSISDDSGLGTEMGGSAVQRQIIVGATRASANHTHTTGDYQKAREEWDKLFQTQAFRSVVYVDLCVSPPAASHIRYSAQPTSYTDTYLPQIAELYRSVHPNDPSLRARFGVFHSCAFNLPTGGSAATTRMHRDHQNPAAGICWVLPYGNFDHKKDHLLVLRELGVILEVPRGSMVGLPSALVTHGNISIRPAGESTPHAKAGCERGSLVFYSSANVVLMGHTKGKTLKAVNGRRRKEMVFKGVDDMFKFPSDVTQ
ncbi:hypothetical protein Rhopal_003640-T1 [Rhodotorula paludigena]|uniref:Uncharacterized protein n=1 Tax=Rhodotorula paludigena TaxID=86838 RepID=A0AAV5GK96_9BASI|nr:hypothetical protein Rhopal_003640-T1 [Rhodotorula paludigena]